MNMREFFLSAYTSDVWGPGSGVGSRPEFTERYRAVLAKLLAAEPINSVLDIGCGDWQVGSLVPWDDRDYTGVDIVPSVVESLTKQYAGPRRRFVCGNALEMDLPPADLLIVKDVMQHWLAEEIVQFLPRMARYPLALVTNDSYDHDKPIDWRPRWHPIDLCVPPYNLEPGEVLLVDRLNPYDPPKITTLYRGRP